MTLVKRHVGFVRWSVPNSSTESLITIPGDFWSWPDLREDKASFTGFAGYSFWILVSVQHYFLCNSISSCFIATYPTWEFFSEEWTEVYDTNSNGNH